MNNPTPEQEQRAKWDLLLLELEMRSEELRQLKTLGPLDLEKRTMEVILMKRFETWKAVAALATASATVAGVIVGVAHLLR